MLIAMLYGALVWGVLPINVRVSWETHLAAALIGVLCAFALRSRDIPPRKRYSWEDEAEDAEPIRSTVGGESVSDRRGDLTGISAGAVESQAVPERNGNG